MSLSDAQEKYIDLYTDNVRLRQRIADLEKDLSDCDSQWQHAVSKAMQLEQENERLRKDAERWIYARDNGWLDGSLLLHKASATEKDAAIDAARGEE